MNQNESCLNDIHDCHRWVSVKEGLPEAGVVVLTYWHDPDFPSSTDGLGFDHITESGEWYGYESRIEMGEACGITHWANVPLPKEPTDDQP